MTRPPSISWWLAKGDVAQHVAKVILLDKCPTFASTTLQEPLAWNSTLIKGDLVTEVAKLKEQLGKNILMYGAGPVAHTLMILTYEPTNRRSA